MNDSKKAYSPKVEAALIGNMMLLRQELYRHMIDPKRDIDHECGYPAQLTIQDYKLIYDREGIGTRVVDIYPKESWKHDPEVMEDPSGEDTPWEKRWKEIEEEFNIYHELLMADMASGIGSYGILLLGIDDGKPLDQPVDGMDPTGTKRTAGGVNRKIIYIRSFDQSVLSIKAIDTEQKSPRYGQPIMYSVNMASSPLASATQDAASAQQEMMSVDIHWSRCIHLAETLQNSKIYAVPRMQTVFNRSYDLRKLCGGSGEMFWKGGFPGISFEAMPDAAQATMTPTEKTQFREEIQQYQNGMQRYLLMIGMQAKSLAPQVANPIPHFEMFIKSICISLNVPYRIFMGSEEAQLAGAQDKTAWNETLTARRKKYVVPRILRPVVWRLVAMGVIEAPKKLVVTFPSLFTPSRKEQAEIAKNLTEALVKYIQANADVLIQPLEFLTEVLGLDSDLAQSILDKALIADDGTLDNVEEPTELDDEEKKAGIELTRAKATQALRPPPKKKGPTRNAEYAGELSPRERKARIAAAKKRLAARLKL